MRKRAGNLVAGHKKPIVLFLCSANAIRSQMAEALLRRSAGNRFEVFSAGIESSSVHPLTFRVLEEIGVDTSSLYSKEVKQFLGKINVTHAIFLCNSAQRHCPRMFPFTFQSHYWPFDDPQTLQGSPWEMLERFRDTRDAIDATIQSWLETNPRHVSLND